MSAEAWQRELDATQMVRHALAYARKGWHVFPVWWPAFPCVCACPKGADCDSVAKHPITRTGVKEASAMPTMIEAWWARHPYAGIGVATGSISGFWVLDVDDTTVLRGELSPTVRSETGGGGLHFLFQIPEGRKVGNRVRFVEGMDVRGDGGYIIAPPSLHGSGERYRWSKQHHPRNTSICNAPDWVLRKLFTAKKRPPPTPGQSDPRTMLAASKDAAEGERNMQLFRFACWAISKGLSPSEVESSARQYNAQKCSPPLPEHEADRTIKSALRYTS